MMKMKKRNLLRHVNPQPAGFVMSLCWVSPFQRISFQMVKEVMRIIKLEISPAG
jgi:hypothetical protein